MNLLHLLLIVLFVFVMGYRFYLKFLALGVFRIDNQAPTPASHRGDEDDFVSTNRWLLLSHNIAGTVGFLSILGVAIAVVWGWVPAFLWIVVGTLVAGGAYALASLWASLRKHGDSLAGVIYDVTGVWGAFPMYLLAVVVMVLLAALLSVLLGQLLQAHPQATWSFLGLVWVSVLVRRALLAHSVVPAVIWVLAALTFYAATIVLGQAFPLSLSGVWKLEIGGSSVLTFPHELTWATVALILAYQSITAPASHITRPRGTAIGLLLFLLVLLVLSGFIVTAPPLVAPDIQVDAELPSLLPLLFLIVTGGAISGVGALILTGPIVRQIARQQDAPVVSYGSVMMEGVLAVVVLGALCAGFTTQDQWLSLYGVWPEHAALRVWLDLAIIKMGLFVAATGIPYALAVAVVAAVFAALALAMLENVLRALSYSVQELVDDFDLKYLNGPHVRERIAIILVALVTLWLSQVTLGLKHWIMFGVINQLFAGAFLLVIGLILMRLSRNTLFVLIPAFFVLTCALWGFGWLMHGLWNTEEWPLIMLSCGVTALASLTLISCLAAYLRIREQREQSMPTPPGF